MDSTKLLAGAPATIRRKALADLALFAPKSPSCRRDPRADAGGNRDATTGDYITAEVKSFNLREPLHKTWSDPASSGIFCISLVQGKIMPKTMNESMPLAKYPLNPLLSFHRGKSIDWSGAPTTTVEPLGRSVFMAANAISLPISAAVGSAPLLVRR
jgi:hypothetical protein